MYIAGMHLTNGRLTEVIVTSSLLLHSAAILRIQKKVLKTAAEKGGPVKSLPTNLIGKLVIPVHVATVIVPTYAYIIAIPLNGGMQPSFISRFALPNFGLCENSVYVLRVIGCVGLFGIWKALNTCLVTLGQSYNFIGVREKTKITSTGPYAIVRHPMYTTVLAQQLVMALMFWNYVPLASLVVGTVLLKAKIQIEEKLIESDPNVGAEYAEYQKKVTYRLIPRVW